MLTSKYVDYIALGVMAFSLSQIVHSYLNFWYSLIVHLASVAVAITLLSGEGSHHHTNKILITTTLAAIGAFFSYGY
ncbi:MAG: hypothetical protein ACRC8A_19915 [Microcoleaceae cyanobacterium]